MARTIGRKYKNELARLVVKAENEGMRPPQIFDYVVNNISPAAFDTWESAYSEIERLTHDLIMQGHYKKVDSYHIFGGAK